MIAVRQDYDGGNIDPPAFFQKIACLDDARIGIITVFVAVQAVEDDADIPEVDNALVVAYGHTRLLGFPAMNVDIVLVQFVQTYILEPLVVGAEVNINPLFTILGIVAGEMLWGIPGMILAIPIMGITKIVCDHVTPLKPFGFLIGESKKKKDKGITEKIRGWFR